MYDRIKYFFFVALELALRDSSIREEKEKKKYLVGDIPGRRDDCSCMPTTPETPFRSLRMSEADVQALIEFENQLHNSIYIRKR